MAIICVFVGYHVLCIMEFKDLVNLCIHYLGCHPNALGWAWLTSPLPNHLFTCNFFP